MGIEDLCYKLCHLNAMWTEYQRNVHRVRQMCISFQRNVYRVSPNLRIYAWLNIERLINAPCVPHLEMGD